VDRLFLASRLADVPRFGLVVFRALALVILRRATLTADPTSSQSTLRLGPILWMNPAQMVWNSRLAYGPDGQIAMDNLLI